MNGDRIARESTPVSWHPSCGNDGVEQRSSSRWRWRTFGSAFDQLDPYLPGAFVFAHEVYLLAPSEGIEARMTDHQVYIDQLEDQQYGVESWTRVCAATFPLCQRDVREIWQWCGCAPPAEFFRAEYDLYHFLADLVPASSALHAIGVNLTRCLNTLDQCEIERAVVTTALPVMLVRLRASALSPEGPEINPAAVQPYATTSTFGSSNTSASLSACAM